MEFLISPGISFEFNEPHTCFPFLFCLSNFTQLFMLFESGIGILGNPADVLPLNLSRIHLSFSIILILFTMCET